MNGNYDYNESQGQTPRYQTPGFLQQQQGGGGAGAANNMVRALMDGWMRNRQQQGLRPGQWSGPPSGWQPAPREGSPNLFQGPPTTGMGAAPGMAHMGGMPTPPPPMAQPQSSMTPPMPSSPAVPFQGMTGPGLGQGGGNPLSALFSSPPQGGLFGGGGGGLFG